MKKENTSIRLKKIMEDRNLRQIDILNLAMPYCKKYDVKMNKSDISQYCSGKTEPYQDKLYVLGAALDVNEAWLMGYDVPMKRYGEDQTVLRYDAEKEHALNLIEKGGYSWNYSMDPDCDIIIKNSSGEIISCMHDFELVNVYESLQKKNSLTSESLISNLEQFFLSPEEKECIKKYRILDEPGKEIVDTILNKELERIKYIQNQQRQLQAQQDHINQLEQRIVTELAHRIAIPLYGKFASAGDGAYLFDDIPTEKIRVPDTPIARKADFVIGVNGDSMEPDYRDGEKVFVEKTSYLDVGDIGIFLKGSDCYIKERGLDRLISRNKAYDDIWPDESIITIGKVIGKVAED